ncbi:MAG: bifunctional oligoribonuclease/PAP phosphatase NrnA [Desulfomonile sp.]|nr:bifunctional oligoribonuclease/PAP phosphatase NrnA [Desulfomonile sp.]
MIQQIAQILRSEDRFLVVTHLNPDGDAVGSQLGMFLALAEMDKTVWALASERPPETYDFLGAGRLVITDPAEIHGKPSWIIATDSAEAHRISGDISRFRTDARLINIDHHISNPRYGDLNLVQPDATSSAELVLRVLKEAGYTPSQAVAKCLFTGILTDTGCFRFAGVNSGTLLVAAELLDTGFDPSEVTIPLYEEYPLTRVYLERIMLERIEIHLEGRLVMSTLLNQDFAALDAKLSETEDLVNRLREIRGVEVGVLVTALPDGMTRVSLRSKGLVNVSDIARSLGGGGHRRAAGIRTELPPAKVKEELVAAIGRILADSPSEATSSTYN